MKGITLLLSFFFLFGSVRGQKANYEQAERFGKMKFGMLAGSLEVRPNYIGESDVFWYTFKTGDGVRYYYVDPKRGVKRELFDRKLLAKKLEEVTGEVVREEALSLRSVRVKEGGRAVEFKYAKRCFEYDVKENVLVQVEEEVHNSIPVAEL